MSKTSLAGTPVYTVGQGGRRSRGSRVRLTGGAGHCHNPAHAGDRTKQEQRSYRATRRASGGRVAAADDAARQGDDRRTAAPVVRAAVPRCRMGSICCQADSMTEPLVNLRELLGVGHRSKATGARSAERAHSSPQSSPRAQRF
jgi:hypothetical protein